MAKPAAPKEIKEGERIVLIGNGLGERMLDHPYFEASLQLANPGKKLIVRNMCRSAETPGFRPHPSRESPWAFPGAEKFHPDKKRGGGGKGFHPMPDEWLADTVKPDTMLAFFGYNESFAGDGGLENFRGELDEWVKHTLARKYNGKSAPRLVLVSPIAFENLTGSRDLPDGEMENQNLANYSRVMSEVAEANGVEFIDLFTGTRELYATLDEPFTRNGFLPTDEGYRILANKLATAVFSGNKPSAEAKPDEVLAAVKDKNWYWQNDYRMLNDVHVDGRRFNPHGPDNYPDEKKKMREMTEVRDKAIWAAASGNRFDLALADSKTHKLPKITSNYKSSKKNGDPNYKSPELSEKLIETPEGYKVELFASEKDFPNLANPVQISFDDKGRLWAATMPTYPHYRPGDPLPDDKLLIYEDTDGDGKADKETVYADGLHLPIGFEFSPGGVYLSQPPHLMWLPDADGDDKADNKEVVLTGFDSHDTHHAASAFCADPSGAFMMCEGVFLRTNVETPYGPVRGTDGGFYRFSPQKTKLERTTQISIPNPWGYAFDQWGQDFFIHTSSTRWNWNLPVSMKPPYGAKAPGTVDLAPKGNQVRPTSGLEFISSRHFPEAVQGDVLIGNTIGFLGIKQHSISDDGTGYETAFRQDLLRSSDSNFRPSDFEFAPDGSLYALDWHNVLIGHMQHNARDPFRDHMHGRIYRVTYPSRHLVEPAQIAGASVDTLLDNLKLPEYRSRYRSRRALRGHPVDEVMPALSTWVKSIDAADPRSEHHRLEALWVSWGMNQVDTGLLKELLKSDDFHVRAAAMRVLRYNFESFPDDDAAELLQQAAADEHGRVRLEAGMAATWLGKPGAAKAVSIAIEKGTDEWSKGALNAAASRIGGEVEEKEEENPLPDYPKNFSKDEKERFKFGHEIYFREGHCGTCHQADGKGLDPAFPPLENSIFVTGSSERLIKLTLHGLIGPFELNGKKYDGQVPMTPFSGMLNDDEIAAVLTYVRNQFGNEASAITPDEVKKIREKTKDFTGLYLAQDLLKEHPLEK